MYEEMITYKNKLLENDNRLLSQEIEDYKERIAKAETLLNLIMLNGETDLGDINAVLKILKGELI